MKIAPGIHRIGGNSMINAYLVEQAGEVTIVDAGVPGYYKDLDRELAGMGRTPADVRALILTHGHSDHIGIAERLRRERRATGARGPQVAPFTADAAQAVQSLTRLEAISADQVLPGHGDSWTGGIAEAIRQIRQAQKGRG